MSPHALTLSPQPPVRVVLVIIVDHPATLAGAEDQHLLPSRAKRLARNGSDFGGGTWTA